MLVMSAREDGLREFRPLSDVRDWCSCFDVLQANEDEIHMLAPDGLTLAATALHAGASCLCVTLARRGAVYFAAPGFNRMRDRDRAPSVAAAQAIRTDLIPAAAATE